MGLLAALLSPSGAAFILLGLGLVTLVWRRRPGLSHGLLAAGALVLLLFSSGMVASALMSPLEYAYPTLKESAAHPEARRIVVLTAWATEDPEMPLTGRLNSSGAYRVLQAMDLAHERPDCTVILSGDEVSARVMGQALLEIGLPPDRLEPPSGGNTTAESVRLLADRVGDEPFFLVTSGGHMPRSMEALGRHGAKPIPAPTDHQLPRDWRHADWMPSAFHLSVSDLAIHEYLGRIWYRIRSS